MFKKKVDFLIGGCKYKDPALTVPGDVPPVEDGLCGRGHCGQRVPGLQDSPHGRVPQAGVHQGDACVLLI